MISTLIKNFVRSYSTMTLLANEQFGELMIYLWQGFLVVEVESPTALLWIRARTLSK